mgnify:CR=1 FL=1
MKTKLAFDSAITKAIRGAMPQQVTQADVWAGVRDDRNRLVAFVRDRTGASGEDLTKQVYEYETEMKRRYG